MEQDLEFSLQPCSQPAACPRAVAPTCPRIEWGCHRRSSEDDCARDVQRTGELARPLPVRGLVPDELPFRSRTHESNAISPEAQAGGQGEVSATGAHATRALVQEQGSPERCQHFPRTPAHQEAARLLPL